MSEYSEATKGLNGWVSYGALTVGMALLGWLLWVVLVRKIK